MDAPNTDKVFYFRLTIFIAFVAVLFLLPYVVRNQWNFEPLQIDSAISSNVLANNLAGHWFRNTVHDGPNILGQHTLFIYLLLTPVYVVFYNPDCLLWLQTAWIYACLPVIYLIGIEIGVTPVMAFLFSLAFVPAPIFLMMIGGPFLPGTLIFLLVLLAYLACLKKSATGFIIAALLACSCGEQAALTFIALGLSLHIRAWKRHDHSKARKFGWISLSVGAAWLLFAAWFIPWMRTPGQRNLFEYNFSDWHCPGLLELAGAILVHPGKALAMLVEWQRWRHLSRILLAPLLLSLVSWESAILLLPLFPYMLMGYQEFSLYTHGYYFQPIFFAGIVGGFNLLLRFQKQATHLAIILLSVFLINLACFFNLCIVWDLSGMDTVDEATVKLHSIFRSLPRAAVVYSPHRFSFYLSNRPGLLVGDLAASERELKSAVEEHYPYTGIHYSEIEYLVGDLVTDQNGPEGWGYNFQDLINKRAKAVEELSASKKWNLIYNEDNVVIFKRLLPEDELSEGLPAKKSAR